jgi:hypothetical protein
MQTTRTNRRASSRTRIYALLAVFAALVVPAAGRANMANPVRAGDRLGEPSGGLETVTVEHESLAIDLRPLAKSQPALVNATYHVRDTGPAHTLHLLFVADALTDGGTGVWLDGRAIPAARADAGPLPASWRPPAATPGLDGRDALSYETSAQGTFTFHVPLAPGPHEIRVRYRAQPTAHSAGSPARYWQLAYVLAPAREWAGFGGLDVRVELPAGWAAAASPVLRRQGDALVGSWRTLPADALALTARAPVPSALPLWAFLVLASLAAMVLLLWMGRSMGRWLGRRGRSAAWGLIPGVVLSIVYAACVVAGLALVPDLVTRGLGEQRAWGYGYGATIGALLLFPVLLIVAVVMFQIAVSRGRRSASAVPGALDGVVQGG